MSKHKNLREEHDDGSYVVKKSKKHSIFAFILCILIAFIIWAYVEATENAKISDLSDATVSTQVIQETCEAS